MKTETKLITLAIFILAFLFLSGSVSSRKETLIYLGKNGKLTTAGQAVLIQKVRSKSPSVTLVQTLKRNDSKWEKIYTECYKKRNDSTYLLKSGSDKEARRSERVYHSLPDGSFTFKDLYKNQLVREGHSTTKIPLTLHGQLTDYYPNGRIKSVSEYRNNELVSNQNWNESGDPYIDNIFYSTDEEPTFVPGIKVLHRHILKGFKDAGIDISSISGSVVIGFVIMEDGRMEGLKILKGLGTTINTVAWESFRSLQGEWKPARLNNRNVRYFQVFPINFIYKTQSFEFAELRGAILHWGAY